MKVFKKNIDYLLNIKKNLHCFYFQNFPSSISDRKTDSSSATALKTIELHRSLSDGRYLGLESGEELHISGSSQDALSVLIGRCVDDLGGGRKVQKKNACLEK